MNTQDKLINTIKKFKKNDAIEINSTTKIKDLKFDSLDLLEFQMMVDDDFGIEVGIEDFLKCLTVADLILLVDKYQV